METDLTIIHDARQFTQAHNEWDPEKGIGMRKKKMNGATHAQLGEVHTVATELLQ